VSEYDSVYLVSPTAAQHITDLRGVDLSFSLIPRWDMIEVIAGELLFLERLILKSVFRSPCKTLVIMTSPKRLLSNNRFQPFSGPDLRAQSFRRLTELQLSGTLMSWKAMLDVIMRMPSLKHIEMGYNRLTTLGSDQPRGPVDPVLELINLDSNQLSEWDSICHALRPMKQCAMLNLSFPHMLAI
jgi:hypothetical protein